MGLNMPARTVVFTSVQKWDGESHRWISSGEYIQMSGRAGRRGKDDRGVAIMMVNDNFDGKVCKEMVQGEASPLQSTFRLSYYTLLNLLSRSEGLYNTEYVISHSFHQYQYEKQLPAQKAKVVELEAMLANAKAEIEDQKRESTNITNSHDQENAEQIQNSFASDTAEIQYDLRQLEVEMLRLMLRPKICLPFLT